MKTTRVILVRLVISDLILPQFDGIALNNLVKFDEQNSDLPMVMLAQDEGRTSMEGVETSDNDKIARLFNFEELGMRVKRLLDKRKRLREKFSLKPRSKTPIILSPRHVEAMSMDDQFMQKIMRVVEENIGNTSFSVDMFAKELAMSSAQLYRKVTALTNCSPNDFIRHMRLQRAADLLRQRSGNVADVAYQSGFTSLSYFSKCFRQKFGVVPSEYAKSVAPNPPS
jgi:AraC-like DNA-binding protein